MDCKDPAVGGVPVGGVVVPGGVVLPGGVEPGEFVPGGVLLVGTLLANCPLHPEIRSAMTIAGNKRRECQLPIELAHSFRNVSSFEPE